MAGIWARIDGTRGVWKAPAGTEASLTGAIGVSVPLNDSENGVLNPYGDQLYSQLSTCTARSSGARVRLQGNDQIGSEWKYVPVRRMALFIEESLYRGAQMGGVRAQRRDHCGRSIRLNVGAFMQNLFRQGAFQGATPQQAYFVKCDNETTTQNDIDLGIVNIVVGFAPLKPAEFVVIQIQQMAGQLQLEEAGRWLSLPLTRKRFDPYKNFKFRVKWDGHYVAGISKWQCSSGPPRW